MPFIQFAERFNGPSGSAHGGYTCGRLASLLTAHSAAAVTLLAPPPLATDLLVRTANGRLQLWHGEQLLATAMPEPSRPDEPSPDPLAGIDRAAADRAAGNEAAFAGFRWHPFASCFVCGPERSDGMRLLPAPVAGHGDLVAASWVPAAELAGPDGLVLPEFVWAALDCPGGWSAMSGPPEALVLSRLAVRLGSRPRAGERHLVLGRLHRRSGRTAWVSSALLDGAGRLLATGKAQWLSVDPASFGADGRPTLSGKSLTGYPGKATAECE